MNVVRVLSLLLVLSGQVLASGGGAWLRGCVGEEAMAQGHCPCAQKLKAERARYPGTQLDRASCCAIERSVAHEAPVATASFHADAFEAPLAMPVLLPRPVPLALAVRVALRDGARAQGPPVFLKVRSLLL